MDLKGSAQVVSPLIAFLGYVLNAGYEFPVLVTAATGIETIHNAFSSAPTDAVFRTLVIDFETLPTEFFTLDSDSELWEFAERAIPHVLEEMVQGSPRITRDELSKRIFPLWDRATRVQGRIRKTLQTVIDHASRSQFSVHLQRAPVEKGLIAWDVTDNPLVGAADKRLKAWKAMLRKHKSLIDHFKADQRQEVLAIDEGQAVG